MPRYEVEAYRVVLRVESAPNGRVEAQSVAYLTGDLSEALAFAGELAARAEDVRDSDEWKDRE